MKIKTRLQTLLSLIDVKVALAYGTKIQLIYKNKINKIHLFIYNTMMQTLTTLYFFNFILFMQSKFNTDFIDNRI